MADATIINEGNHNAEVKEEIQFPVFMIYSKWSLNRMFDLIKQYGEVGLLRIVFSKDNTETNRTIALMTWSTYENLCADGYGDASRESGSRAEYGFRVTPYKLNEHSFPGKDRNQTLFVPVPKVLGENDLWVMETISDKLADLAEWGIFPKNSWKLNLPLRSREEGGVKGGCFISFSKEVEVERIAMARILLTDTYWPVKSEVKDRQIFLCYWARDHRPPVKKSESEAEGVEGVEGEEKSQSSEEVKLAKKRQAIQNVAKRARPGVKKAPTVPVSKQPSPVDAQPDA